MFELSKEGQEFVKKEMDRYETKRSALIPSLYCVQKENNGWVSDECIQYLSQFMGIPESQIYEVFHFYTMFNKKPVGKLHVQVCNNISCSMNGSKELIQHICETYKTGMNEVSPCGKVTVSAVECLGSCDGAPMMQVNEDYHENLTNEKAVEIIEKCK